MKKKKLIVLILCIFVGCILVLSALYLTGVINVKNIRAYRPSNSAVRAVENQSENFAGGKGTEQDPYLIETSSHLFRLSELVNAQYSNNPYREAFYRQTTDIDLSENGKKWIPIGETYGTGNRIGPFEGNYNGDNHSISGMEINYTDSITESLRYCFGVFGQIGSNGAVENLHIKNSHITVEADTTDYCGAIAGACDGRIVNCHVGDDVTINSGYQAGGITGKAGLYGIIHNCSSSASVETTSAVGSAGGIVADGGKEILNCTNTGNVRAATAGGIVGSGKDRIEYCSNSGNIESDKNEAGGIVGYFSASSFVNIPDSMPGEIRFCTNEGSIRGSYSAGIAAKIAASGEYGALIESCSNSGNIDGDTAGGICSNYYKESSADLKLEILSCTNEGSIRPRNTESQAYCSGILASASVSGQGEIFLQSCENIGDVIAEEGVCGGILAKYVPFTVNNDPVTISLEDCRNAAEIKGGSMGVGGIVGSVTSLKDGSRILLRIDSSENTGIIRTNGCYVRMGGLVGVLNSCSAGMEIKNSTNSGELIPDEEDVSHDLIPVNDVIGGIIGLVGDDGPDPTIDADNRMAYAPDLIIENCINNGELHQNEDGRIYHLGDMIGYTVVDVDIK